MEYKSQLFVFSKIFIHPENLAEAENLDFNITELEVNWKNFWEEHGLQIVHSSWIPLYGAYINTDYTNLGENISKLNLTEENILNENNTKDNINNELDWQRLWEEHYQNEYIEYFNLFSKNFYIAAKNFILNPKLRARSKSFSEDYSTLDDSANLRALGLPTTFSGNKVFYKYRKRSSHNLMEEFDEEFNKEAENKTKEKESYILYDPEVNKTEMQSDENESMKTHKGKTQNRQLRKMPSYLQKDKKLTKYWRNRFRLFSRFDEGIKLDKEGWFSVTPENIAKNIANRMSHCDIVIDGFCGSGGNTIQLAMKCKKVIAIDIDPIKIEMAKHNAKIYNVDHNIEFIVGDFFQLCEHLKGDGVILSVPWGGPNYTDHRVYDIEKSLLPLPATQLMESCRKISENIALFIPKNSNKNQAIKLAGVGKQVEIEQNYIDNRLVALTCYYGNLIDKKK